MFQQVIDFQDESEALCDLLNSLSDEEFQQQSQFKSWTFNHIIGHLHMWNWAADLALSDPAVFQQFLGQVMASVQRGKLREYEENWLIGLHGRRLLDVWRDFFSNMCRRFGEADPKARVEWAGPSMSVRSSITSRLMETWAHGQAVYDLLGNETADTDRIKNIVVLGVKTFGWSFKNRGLPVPEKPPRIRLTALSGEIWEFDKSDEPNRIEGSATEFCQIVTQVRNIADTNLTMKGDVATQWMAIAQCFAGPPEDPPTAGSRFAVTQS